MAQPILDNVPVLDNFNKINTAIAELNQALIDINTVESGLAAEAIARAAADSTLQSNIDAKVEDALVNGVTTKAPSQNIVFDQLALKQNSLGYTAEDSSQKGIAGGYASLDGTGKVPSAQLPSFVDDVIEAANFAALPGTGETGKIYVTLDNNKTYRWSGSAYVEISASPGSTDSVTEGSVNLYFTAARVLATVLTGLSLVTGTPITASDTALVALGKLQKQITDLGTTLGSIVSATLANIASAFHGATSKTPVDADEVAGMNSAASFAGVRYTWTNIKAFLKTYFDTLYQAILVSGTNIKTINGSSILGAGNLTVSGGGGGREVITASLSTNQDNYTITGMSTSAGVLTILELTLTASIKFTGLNKTISAVDVEDGKVVRIFNTSSVFGDGYLVILERGHAASGSSAANRLYNPVYNGMPPILQPNAYIDYQYSTTIGAWIFLSSSEWGNPYEFFDLYSDFMSGPAPFLAQTGTGSHDSVDQRHLNTTIQQTVGTIGVTTTSSTSRYHIGTQNASIFPGFNSILGMLRVCPNALSDATDEYIGYFGFHDTFFSSTPPVDAACWVYDRLSSTDWRILTGKASTLSYTTVTGFTPSISEYHYLGIFINGNATRVDFFYSVDGESWVFAGSKTGSSVPNTTSNTFGFAFGMNRSAGAGSKKVYCDWMGYRLSMKRGA